MGAAKIALKKVIPAMQRAESSQLVALASRDINKAREAARQLGVPQGTVASRLARARATLAKRLAVRGLALSAGALADLLSHQAASAFVPPALKASTIRAVTQFAASPAAAAGEAHRRCQGRLAELSA